MARMAESTDNHLRSYFQQGDIWEQEIVKRAKRSARSPGSSPLIFAGSRCSACLPSS